MTRATIKAHYDADGNYLYFVYGYKPDTHESKDNDNTSNKTPQKILAFILLAFIVAVAMMATTM